jgi:hypothetical protein
MRTIRSGNFWIGVVVGAVVVPYAMRMVSGRMAPKTATPS